MADHTGPDRETPSPLGGVVTYGGSLVLHTLVLQTAGLVSAGIGTFADAFRNYFLFAWVLWLSWGGLMGFTADQRRSERVPF